MLIKNLFTFKNSGAKEQIIIELCKFFSKKSTQHCTNTPIVCRFLPPKLIKIKNGNANSAQNHHFSPLPQPSNTNTSKYKFLKLACPL